MDEVDPKIKAWQFLQKNHLATLATITENNLPQAAIVYYITDEDFNIYIVTTGDSRKLQNIKANNHIALVINHEDTPQVLQIEGQAQILEDEAQKGYVAYRYLDEIASPKNPSHMHWPPIMKLHTTHNFVFIQIKVNHYKFSDFNSPDAEISEGNLA